MRLSNRLWQKALLLWPVALSVTVTDCATKHVAEGNLEDNMNAFPLGFILLVIALIVLVVMRKLEPATESKEQLYCPHCGTVGKPKLHLSGYVATEILYWMLFVLPGMMYSVWRSSTERWVCPKCGMPGMIPVDTPVARQALAARGSN